jgi:hypothetical protein
VSANAEVIRHLVTKEYDDLAAKGFLKPRFQHINTYEDHAKIADYESRKIVSVYFRDNEAYCDLDDAMDCEHIECALTLDDVREALKANGWKRRKSRE